MENEEFIVLFEAPKIEKPEFRLYHDKKGRVICYTCEKLEGDYIVIDALTFAEARPDLVVVNGRAIRENPQKVIARLTPSDEGTPCHIEDVSIVVNQDSQNIKYWKMIAHEL